MIKTEIFTKDKAGGGSSGSSSTVSKTNIITRTERASQADKLTETHNIWGNEFDGTQDVNGDLLIDRNHKITVNGDAQVNSYNNPDSYVHVDSSKTVGESGKVDMKNMDIDATNTEINITSTENNNSVHLNTKDGLTLHGTNSVHSNNINVDVLRSETADVITVESPLKLNAPLDLSGQSLTVDTLYSKDITNDGEIKTQDLTVYGNAHFFNLVIDEVQHAGGSIILSPANFIIDAIEDGSDYTAGSENCPQYYVTNSLTDTYHTVKLYQICYDPETQKLAENKWLPGDHAFCHTFNLDNNTSKHYWTPVIAVAHDVEAIVNGRPERCNMIEIVNTITTTGELRTTLPENSMEIGDNIACLGSKNKTRKDAIMISSTKSYDPQCDAPCIVQYTGIDSFSLKDKQYSYLAKNGNRLRGNFLTESGLNFEDYLADGLDRTPYVHVAYANDKTGKDFTKNRDSIENPSYIGFRTDFNISDEELIWSDYTWSRFFDENEEEPNHGLLTIRERLYVNNKNDLYIDVAYSKRTLTAVDYIKVFLFTIDGQATIYNVENVEDDSTGTPYYFLTQKLQENWVAKPVNEQFSYARVVLYGLNDTEIDSHSFMVSWDAGAMFEITDKIISRVSDAEGNISTLQQDAKSILARVQSLEAAGDTDNPDSLYSRVGALEVRADGIDASVEGVRSDVNNVTGQLTETRNQLSDLQMRVDSIDLSVQDTAIGGTNILSGTNFGHLYDEPKNIWNVFDNNVVMNPVGLTADVGEAVYNGDAITSTKDYIDIIQQTVTGKLKPETWYTLSFYAYSGSDFTTYVYPNVGKSNSIKYVDGQASGNIGSDCNHRWTIEGDGWVKHKMSFFTSANITTESTHHFLIRMWKSESHYTNLRITQLKLEEGQTATAYEQSEHDWESRIGMTAQSITLNVKDGLKNTGIDIESGKITLRGDRTQIDGTLNVTSSGSGIVITDDDGSPCVNIRKEAVGNLANISKTGYGDITKDDAWYNYDQNEGMSLSKEFVFDLGYLNSGDNVRFVTVEFDNAFVFHTTVTGKNSQGVEKTVCPYMTLDFTIEIKIGTSVQYSKTVTKSLHKGNKYTWPDDLPVYIDPSFTATSSGNATCTITCKQTGANHLATVVQCSNLGIAIWGYPITLNMSCNFGFKRIVKTLTKLGTDGIYVAGKEKDQYLYCGPDGIEMVWNRGINPCGINIKDYDMPKMLYYSDSSGKSDGKLWGAISDIRPYWPAGIVSGNGSTIDQNGHTLCCPTPEQTFIVCGGRSKDDKGFYVWLPHYYELPNGKQVNVPNGKRYIIKDDVVGSNTIAFTNNGKTIINTGKHTDSGVSSYTISNMRTVEFMADGAGHWYVINQY